MMFLWLKLAIPTQQNHWVMVRAELVHVPKLPLGVPLIPTVPFLIALWNFIDSQPLNFPRDFLNEIPLLIWSWIEQRWLFISKGIYFQNERANPPRLKRFHKIVVIKDFQKVKMYYMSLFPCITGLGFLLRIFYSLSPDVLITFFLFKSQKLLIKGFSLHKAATERIT